MSNLDGDVVQRTAPSRQDVARPMMPHLPTLLIQVVVILLMARLAGWLFRKIHQPQVIGEMVAGILLGP
ncbi:MAG: hypothetical protein DMF60_12100, partial [Acidobacteria bacterium]